MARVVHRYDPPERFVAGTVGEPGARTFFLQARAGRRITSVSLEKEQVAVLAGRVEEILDQAPARPGNSPLELETVDNDPLEAPIAEDFRVGTLVLAWQPSTTPGGDRLVVQAYAVDPAAGAGDSGIDAPDELTDELVVTDVTDPDELDTDDSDPELVSEDDAEVEVEEIVDPLAATEEDTDALVVRLDRAAARAFARRCATVVAAGRPPCPFCGRPLDPAGHLCPRANGYRPARA
jgi:uncharacterized repeat protein (TIGR03847 family)